MKSRRIGAAVLIFLVAFAAFPASARSEFDFDVDSIPLSYITRPTNGNAALTNSSARTWLEPNGRIEISVTLQNTATQVIFAQGSSDAVNWQLLVVNGKWRLQYGGDLITVENSVPAANTKYDIVCERRNGKLYLTINDIECVKDKDVAALERGVGLMFFHRKSGSNWNNSPSTMKFHYARIYNDGELVAEYVPCAYKIFTAGLHEAVGDVWDTSSAIGFDWADRAAKIHERFCNEGTSDGGEEVDWVTTRGVEVLQTDFLPDTTDVIKMKFAITAASGHQTAFSAGGAKNGAGDYYMMELLCLQAGTWRPSFGSGAGTADGSWTTNVDYEVEYSAADGFKVNDTFIEGLPNSTGAGTFVPVFGFTFFSRIQLNDGVINPLSCPAKCKFYWAKVYASDGTTLKAHFVPYVDGDGFAGIKEKISGKVFLPLFGRLTPSNGARPHAVYVSPDAYGDDTNAGSFRSPYKKLTSGVTATVTGGTVYLKEGTHVFDDNYALEGANKAHALIGVSDDPSKVVINGATKNRRAFLSRTSNGAVNGAFKNMTFRNFTNAYNGATIYSAGALIENCVFEDNEVSISDNEVKGGIIYANGGNVKRCVFRNNRVSGTSALGSAALLLGNCVVENCLFEGNVSDGPEGRCCTVYIGANSTAVVRNCTFVKNGTQSETSDSTAGIRIDSAGARVVNTVFCGNSHNLGGSVVHSVARFMVGSFDTVFSNCSVDYAIGSNGRVIDNAVFTDWANGDYSPHGMSRLINRGSGYLGGEALPEQYGTDLLGNPRYVGAGIDIGAYEWQGKDPCFGITIMIR